MTGAIAEPVVTRDARIFRFGHYPKKGWGITREQFVAANGEAGTVPIGLDPIGKAHYQGLESILDGETGSASFSVAEGDVPAKLSLPALVERAVAKHGLKLSAVFDRASGRLKQVDFVERPHIPDAVMFSDEHGDVMVFEDDPTEPEPEPDAEFADSPEEEKADTAQVFHDLASHGDPDLCTPGARSGPGDTHALTTLRQIHDIAVAEGAFCPGMPDGFHAPEKEVGMSDAIENEEDTQVEFSEETPREKAQRLRIERLEAALTEKDAVAFADEMTLGTKARAHRAERRHLIDGYKRAAADDSKLGDTVTFSDGEAEVEGTRLDAFLAHHRARPLTAVRGEKTVGFDLDAEPAKAAADADLEALDKRARAVADQLNGKK